MIFKRNSTPRTSNNTAPEKDISSTLPVTPNPKSTNPAVAVGEDGVVVVGKGTRVGGTIGECRILDVHGVVEADIIAETLIIREGGGVLGTIKVDSAEIHGVVEGSMTVYDHLEIAATGNISGQVSFQTLAVATGARLAGDVVTTEAAAHRANLRDISYTTLQADYETIGQERSAINGAGVKTRADEIFVPRSAT